MGADAYSLLFEATLLLTLACVLVLSLRLAVRAAFGARVAYLLWLLVPLAVLVAFLPEPSASVALPLPVLAPVIVDVAPGDASRPSAWPTASVALWLLGVLLAGAWETLRQRHFIRSIGRVRIGADEALRSEADVGPMVVGVWRPRIVLPHDFEQRFGAAQQQLILEHERVHLARGDLRFNALALALRCLQWFNPVVHLAWSRFRRDQEFAADAVVLARRPREARAYAEAMFELQHDTAFSPLGCHWRSVHPIKERIMMLKRPLPGLRRTLFGAVATTGLTLAVAYAAWATQPIAVEEVEQQATYAAISPPKYPAESIKARSAGDVFLRVLVGADGLPQQIEVDRTSGDPRLDEAAMASVRKWRFNPARDGDVPVAAWVGVPINFALDGPVDAPSDAAPVKGALDEIRIRPR